MTIKTIKVTTAALNREFNKFSYRLYADDPSYIHPMEHDIEAVFDSKKNKFFKKGTCERYLFIDTQGITVGKVAVFINNNYEPQQRTGGFGFIDFIEDYSVAAYIFDFCVAWHRDRDIQVLDGPINFGERDKFWGLLIEGFTPPLYGMNYHKPYYQAYFERYGFQQYYQQLCFSRAVTLDLNQKYELSHASIRNHYPEISVSSIRKNNLDKYAADFTEVYNKAWASHGGGKTMELRQAKKIFSSMKPIMDEHLCYFVYHYDTPIGMWINLPDLNYWFRHLRGKFTLWHKLKFLMLKRTKPNPKAVGIVFGIVPEWQRKGLDNYMIYEATLQLIANRSYKQYEMQWIGSFNPKMINIAKSLDTEVSRILATYRIMIDPSLSFSPHKSI